MRVLWGVGGEGVECRERPRFHVRFGCHVRYEEDDDDDDAICDMLFKRCSRSKVMSWICPSSLYSRPPSILLACQQDKCRRRDCCRGTVSCAWFNHLKGTVDSMCVLEVVVSRGGLCLGRVSSKRRNGKGDDGGWSEGQSRVGC